MSPAGVSGNLPYRSILWSLTERFYFWLMPQFQNTGNETLRMAAGNSKHVLDDPFCLMNFSHFRGHKVVSLQRLAYSHQSIWLANLSDITQLVASAVASAADWWDNKKLTVHLEINSDFSTVYYIIEYYSIIFSRKFLPVCEKERERVCVCLCAYAVWNSSILNGKEETRRCCQRSLSVIALQLKRIKRKKRQRKRTSRIWKLIDATWGPKQLTKVIRCNVLLK